MIMEVRLMCLSSVVALLLSIAKPVIPVPASTTINATTSRSLHYPQNTTTSSTLSTSTSTTSALKDNNIASITPSLPLTSPIPFSSTSHFTSEDAGSVGTESTVGDVNIEESADTEVENRTSEVKENTKEAKKIVLVDGKVPSSPSQLIKCRCGAKEVLTREGCQIYQGDTFIASEDKAFTIIQKAVSNLDLVIHDPECKTVDGHRQMNFTGDEFYLRRRGDVVLKKSVGLLEGLRINNYCVTHAMDDGGHVTLTMKACIPPPSVPRCCPPGKAMDMQDGQCRPARSPTLLTPPISADVFKGSVHWPYIENHTSTLTCVKDPIKSLHLELKRVYLMNVPTGMVLIWNPAVSHITRKFFYPNQFCVDGRETSSGVVEYTANVCYSDPLEAHIIACQGHTCIRKCCKHGQIMSSALYKCVDKENSTFSPPFIAEPASYNVVIGYPLCPPKLLENNITLDNQGYLLSRGVTYQPPNYCIDEVTDGKGNFMPGALLCHMSLSSSWDSARAIAFPVCHTISLAFLALAVVCYCLVPMLLQQGGWCQLFHILSMMLAYSSSLAQLMLGQNWDDVTCTLMAILMQFGYLCTFFWLSVLCFKVWRNIRSLYKFLPAPNLSIWIYMVYAFGGPFIICTVTLCMHYLVPEGAEGVVKPGLAVSRCWFSGTMETLAYFYGPIAFLLASNIVFIAHTLWLYKRMEKSISTTKDLWINDPGSEDTKALRVAEHTNRKRDSVADFKQQFSLLALMCICWVTEVLSWKIPPSELWALTDILNSLQGFFVFIIVISNKRKRIFIRKKFPWIFSFAKKVTLTFCSKSCCRQAAGDGEDEATISEASCSTPCSSFSEGPKLPSTPAMHLTSCSTNSEENYNTSSKSPVTEGSS